MICTDVACVHELLRVTCTYSLAAEMTFVAATLKHDNV